jgi:hypothetical protein
LRIAVEIVVLLDPDLLARFDERRRHGIHGAQILDAERASDAVPRKLSPALILGSLEERADIGVAPPLCSLGRPSVVVERVAANVDHRVHRARAAEQLAARHVEAPAEELGLGLGEIGPIVARLEQPGKRGRNARCERLACRAGFEQKNPHARLFREPSSENAPGRPGSDDDEIVLRAAFRPHRRDLQHELRLA